MMNWSRKYFGCFSSQTSKRFIKIFLASSSAAALLKTGTSIKISDLHDIHQGKLSNFLDKTCSIDKIQVFQGSANRLCKKSNDSFFTSVYAKMIPNDKQILTETQQETSSDNNIEKSIEESDFKGRGFSKIEKFDANWDKNWDDLHHTYHDNDHNYSKKIFLVRHGQYFLNSGCLTPLGQEQADITGKYLKDVIKDQEVVIHCSNMPRAIQTASIIGNYFNDCTISIHKDIREKYPCRHTFPDSNSKFIKTDEKITNDEPLIMKGFYLIFKRPIKEKEPIEIWVYHANLIRFHMLKALQVNHFRWLNLRLFHASVSEMEIKKSGDVRLISMGNYSHIPYEKSSYMNV